MIAMPDKSYFAEKARRCRDLMQIAVRPEVKEQLRLWVIEFNAMASTLSSPMPE